MPRADWTYEVPPLGSGTIWVEEYLVYDAEGEPVGKVFAVLEHDGQLFLGIEREQLPLKHHRHAIPFDAIDEIDDEHAAIHLNLRTLELDPDKNIEGGPADATRVTEVPPEHVPPATPPAPAVTGPVDRPPSYLSSLLVRGAGVALLAVGAIYGIHRTTTVALFFTVPAVILLLALLSFWRGWVVPWQAPNRRARRQ
jgi:hypothetical protein